MTSVLDSPPSGGGGGGGGIGGQIQTPGQSLASINSLQNNMAYNRRLVLLNRYLPGFTTDPTVVSALVNAATTDDAMLNMGLDMAGESYLQDISDQYSKMDPSLAEAKFNQLTPDMQNSLRVSGYEPASEHKSGSFLGSFTHNFRVPGSGRLKQVINKATRLLPGVQSGPFSDQSNVSIGFDRFGGPGKVLNAVVGVPTVLPFRLANNAIKGVFKGFTAIENYTTRVYRTGALLADRRNFKGTAADGTSVYGDEITGDRAMTGREILENVGGSPLTRSLSGIARAGVHHPSSVWRAWGDAARGEETFHIRQINEAAQILSEDGTDYETQGSDLWLARKIAGGTAYKDILKDLNIQPDTPAWDAKLLEIASKTGDEKFQQAIIALDGGRISYGNDIAREVGLDPDSKLFKVAATAGDMAFVIMMDPTLHAGAALKVMRTANRWKITALGIQGFSEVQKYEEITRSVRWADKTASEGRNVPKAMQELQKIRDAEVTGSHWFTADGALKGADIRQARRTIAEQDRVVAAFAKIESFPMGSTERDLAIAEFLSKNQKYERSWQSMWEYHNQARVHGKGLDNLDGLWNYYRAEVGQLDILSTKAGGVRSDIRELPQLTRMDKIMNAGKEHFFDFTKPIAKYDVKELGDIEAIVKKIEDAKRAGTFNVKKRNIVDKALGRRIRATIDSPVDGTPVIHLDVDALLNFTLDTPKGMLRRNLRSLFIHAPQKGTLPLDTAESVQQFKRVTQMGVMSHMPQEVMDGYLGAFAAANVGDRQVIVEKFFRDMFYRSGITAYEDGALNSYYTKFVGKTRQSYSIFDRDTLINHGIRTKGALFTRSQGDDVIMIPSFRDLLKATKDLNRHRYLFGYANPNHVDHFVTKIWAPFQLLRIGFIPRAAGEELLAFTLRQGPLKYLHGKASFAGSGLRTGRGGPVITKGKTAEQVAQEVHELSVLRPLNWLTYQTAKWAGIKGVRFEATATAMAMKSPVWGTAAPEIRRGLLEAAQREIRNGKKWAVVVDNFDGWLERASRKMGGGLHSIAQSTHIPSKVDIGNTILKVGDSKLTGHIGARFGTEADLNRQVAMMMMTDPVMQRQILEVTGHTFEPWLNRSGVIDYGASMFQDKLGTDQIRAIIMRDVDRSNFRQWARTEDATEYFFNYSSLLERYTDDKDAMAAVKIFNQYVDEESLAVVAGKLESAGLDPALLLDFTDGSLHGYKGGYAPDLSNVGAHRISNAVAEGLEADPHSIANFADKFGDTPLFDQAGKQIPVDGLYISRSDVPGEARPIFNENGEIMFFQDGEPALANETSFVLDDLQLERERRADELRATRDEALGNIDPNDPEYAVKHEAVQTEYKQDYEALKDQVRSQRALADYEGGYSSAGRGTAAGDAKDAAMRDRADGFIGEISTAGKASRPSSTSTSAAALGAQEVASVEGAKVLATGDNAGGTIMLARNGRLRGKELTEETKQAIALEAQHGAHFVVGDMPGVDEQYINYLDEIGGNYTIYHAGDTPRIERPIASRQEALGHYNDGPLQVPTEQELMDANLDELDRINADIDKQVERVPLDEEGYDGIIRDIRAEGDMELNSAREQLREELDRIKVDIDKRVEQVPGLDRVQASYQTRVEAAVTSPPSNSDVLVMARRKWKSLPDDEKQLVRQAVDGTASSTILDEQIDPFTTWLIENHSEMTSREWTLITEMEGEHIITSWAEMTDRAHAATETSLRQSDSPAFNRAIRTALGPDGHLTQAARPGMQYHYTPMGDKSLASTLKRLADDMPRRNKFRMSVRDRLVTLGYDEKAANDIAAGIYNSLDPDVVDALLETGRNRYVAENTERIPLSYFVHSDDRVARVVAEELDAVHSEITSGQQVAGFKTPPTVGRVELPEKLHNNPLSEGINTWGSGRVVRGEWYTDLHEVNPDKGKEMYIVANTKTGERSVLSRPPHPDDPNVRLIEKMWDDGTARDRAITTLSHAQVGEMLDTVSSSRSGGQQIFHELTAPMEAGRMDRITSQAIMERSVMSELPQHVFGPTLIDPSELSKGRFFQAFVRGGFDDVIAPAIGAIARTPQFHANLKRAYKSLYELQFSHGPNPQLSKRILELGLDPDMFTPIVETLWDAHRAGSGLPLLEGQDMANLAKALQVDDVDTLGKSLKALGVDTKGWSTKDFTDVKRYATARHYGYAEFRQAAIDEAMTLTIPFIDDHKVRSQFQEHVRGLMPFWFAEEQFMKRWARGVYESPDMLRKAQLTMSGFKDMGFIQKDTYGNDVFVMPGSEYVNQIIGAALTPVFGKPAMAVIGNPLSVNVNFVSPGVNNQAPNGFQFGPVISAEMNFAASRFPELQTTRDTLLGSLNANRWDTNSSASYSLWSSFVPSQYRNLVTAIKNDPSDTGLMSAQIQAVQYLLAEGKGPASQEDTDIEEFLDRTRNTARIILATRGLTSAIAGSSMSPLLKTEPQSVFSELINSGLDFPDAVKIITERFGGDASAYTVFGTKSQSGAPIPYTEDSLNYMRDNSSLFDNFDMAAPWFLPQDRGEGNFGILETRARNEALANELRIRRTPEQVLRSIYVAQASETYFDSRDRWIVARLQLTSDNAPRDQVKGLDKRWRTWRDTYLAQHPVFHTEISTPKGQVRRDTLITQARDILASPDMIPETKQKGGILTLMQGLVDYRDAMDSLKNVTGSRATDQRRKWRIDFYNASKRYADLHPELLPFFNSVIRPEIGSSEVTKIEFGNG